MDHFVIFSKDTITHTKEIYGFQDKNVKKSVRYNIKSLLGAVCGLSGGQVGTRSNASPAAGSDRVLAAKPGTFTNRGIALLGKPGCLAFDSHYTKKGWPCASPLAAESLIFI
jgi:hypothetical protein